LAAAHNKPFVSIHHLEAHAMIARLAGVDERRQNETPTVDGVDGPPTSFQPKVEFPFLTFLASGGHTILMICHGLGDYEFLGGTLDDSLGEVFDKASRWLGLPSGANGGGVMVEKLAKLYETKYCAHLPGEIVPLRFTHNFVVPLQTRKNCDFSYSGILEQLLANNQRL
jgi:N6-L-threonylcarbamoyladenine synthase